MTGPETGQVGGQSLDPPKTDPETTMPLEVIHPVLCLAFLAVWIMAGAIVVREH